MVIKNPKKFGLDANRALADVKDKRTALKNLDINVNDLDVIYESTNASPPVTFDDFRSFSRLVNPIYKTADRFDHENDRYTSILEERAGVDAQLFGNLNVNGKISGSAIRYRYILGSGGSAQTKIADISTSRVSAWSSSASPVLDTSPISYGSEISIRQPNTNKGALKFGTQAGGVSGPRLQTTLQPTPKIFDSEIPTSLIECTINGQTVKLFAMKGIPVIFKGFFRRMSGEISRNPITVNGNEIEPSWQIIETNNSSSYTRYSNKNKISYRTVRARERNIEIYYPPSELKSIKIRSVNIEEIPPVKFDAMVNFDLAFNQLKNFPDFANMFSSPFRKLDVQRNPFSLSETATERKFNQAVIAKLPETTETLTIGGCFYGSIGANSTETDIDQDALTRRLGTNLKTLSLYRRGGAYHHADNADTLGDGSITCTCPNVGEEVISYDIRYNDFRGFKVPASGSMGPSGAQCDSESVKTLPKLETAYLDHNYSLTDSTFSIASSEIVTLNISSTGLPMPDLSGKEKLKSYNASHTRNHGIFFTTFSGGVYSGYKLANCLALEYINISHSGTNGLTGALPVFANPALKTLYTRYSWLQGGSPTATDGSGNWTGGDYVIPQNCVAQCPDLVNFRILSSKLLQKPIHPQAFANNTKLKWLEIYSYNRVTGNMPSLANNPQLTHLRLMNNNMDGTINTNFSTNPNIYYIQMSNNNLTGTIPGFKNLSKLRFIYLSGNNLQGLVKFENLQQLRRFQVQNNQLTGLIPTYNECPRLQYLILFNNDLDDYTVGAIATNYWLRVFDVSFNKLSSTNLDDIANDLYLNYTNSPRGGVRINIRGNRFEPGHPYSTLSDDALEKIQILQTKGWNITYQ